MSISQVLKKVYGEEEYRARMSKCWRETRRGGRPVLVSPEGRVYYGTAAEVREAGLAPWHRGHLAGCLRSMRRLVAEGTVDAVEGRKDDMARRRDAIRDNARERQYGNLVFNLPLADAVRLGAAARVVGKSEMDFEREAVLAAVADAEARCGGRLPFTRHEAAALAFC